MPEDGRYDRFRKFDAEGKSKATSPVIEPEQVGTSSKPMREQHVEEHHAQSSTMEQINNEVVIDVSGNETLLEAVARLPSAGGVVNVPPAESNITVGTGVVDRPTVVRGPGWRDGTAVLEGQVEFDYAVDLGFDAVGTAMQALSAVEGVTVSPAAGETGIIFNGANQPSYWNWLQNVLVHGDGNGIQHDGQVSNHLFHNVNVHNVGGWGFKKDTSTGASNNSSNFVITKMRVRNATDIGFQILGPHSGVNINSLSVNQCGADADGASAKLEAINGLRWMHGHNEENEGAIWLEGCTIARLGQVGFRSNGGVSGITSSGNNTAGNLLIDSRDTTSNTEHVTLDGYEAQDADAGYDVVIGSGVNTGAVRELTTPIQATTAPSGRFAREASTLRLAEWNPAAQVFRPIQAKWRWDNREYSVESDLEHIDQNGNSTTLMSINRNGSGHFRHYPAQNLSGVTGNNPGESRMDDGTNTPSGDPELCIWNGTAWRVSGTTTTFT